jgi:nucleolar pre-ribosomal-associated protein 1
MINCRPERAKQPRDCVSFTFYDYSRLVISSHGHPSPVSSMPNAYDTVLRLIPVSIFLILIERSLYSQLYHIIALMRAAKSAIRSAATSLANDLLSRSVLFEHDPAEVAIWLNSLSVFARRASSARTPDGTPLNNEFKDVLAFLDDCILRCQKTPYRYLEESFAITFGSAYSETRSPATAPSPLLATVIDQFSAKRKASKSQMSPSMVLALATYLRTVLVGLVGKQPDVNCTIRILRHVNRMLEACIETMASSSSINRALAREHRLIARILSILGAQEAVMIERATTSECDVERFLEAMESETVGEYYMGPYECNAILMTALQTPVGHGRTFPSSWIGFGLWIPCLPESRQFVCFLYR